MSNPLKALIHAAKLAGVLDDEGTLLWDWFTNPKGKFFKSAVKAPNHNHLGGVVRSLVSGDPPYNINNPYLLDEADSLPWEPFIKGNAESDDFSGAGLVWKKDGDRLYIGIAARSRSSSFVEMSPSSRRRRHVR